MRRVISCLLLSVLAAATATAQDGYWSRAVTGTPLYPDRPVPRFSGIDYISG
jgi:hypothetical protein